MKKILSIISVFVAIALLTGCATVQTIGKDDASLLAVKIAAKRIGYAVAKNNPQYKVDIIAYAEALANAEDSSKLINEAIPLALKKLNTFAVDPVLQSDIADLVTLIKLKIPDVDIGIKSNMAKAALGGFVAGCKLAQ